MCVKILAQTLRRSHAHHLRAGVRDSDGASRRSFLGIGGLAMGEIAPPRLIQAAGRHGRFAKVDDHGAELTR